MASTLVTKYCIALQSEDKKKRRNVLDELGKELLSNKNASEDDMMTAFKSILKAFSDEAEACRELAVDITIKIFGSIPASKSFVVYLIPVLTRRIGQQEIIEPSEEVRLLMVKLMRLVVSIHKETLHLYLDELVRILKSTLIDPYPLIKRESCECAGEIAKAIPREFHLQSESLIQPILSNFTNRQFIIRVAAVNSIGDVVQYGNNKSVDDVVGPLAQCLFDQKPNVRKAVTEVVGNWLLHLRDRYSYFHRLLPLLLTSLSDELESVRSLAESLWASVGLQYLQENETDLKDKIDFMAVDPAHYPAGVTRPNLGCRVLVQRNIGRLVPVLLSELHDWLPEVRAKAAQLLRVLLLNAEGNVTQHLQKLLEGLYVISDSSDTAVVADCEKSAEYVGYFVSPDTYCDLVVPALETQPSYGRLRVLAAIIRGTERKALVTKLVLLGNLLHDPQIRFSREVNSHQQLLRCCSALIAVGGEDCSIIAQQLFDITVAVMGITTSETVASTAEGFLEEISHVAGAFSVAELYERHTGTLIKELEPTAQSWTIASPHKSTFEALLTHAGSAIGPHLNTVLTMLTIATGPEMDPAMKMRIFTILSSIMVDKALMLKMCPIPNVFVNTLIKDILAPNLVWKAGRTAEALRTAALGCLFVVLAASFEWHQEEVQTLVDILLPLLLSLVEDRAAKTRLFSLKVLNQLIILLRKADQYTAEHLHEIQKVIVHRMDDVNQDVRLAGVRTITTLFDPHPPDFDAVCSEAPLEASYKTMLLFLDDPEPGFPAIVLDALKKMATTSPGLLEKIIESTKQNFRNQQGCNELLDYVQNLKRTSELC